MSRFPRCAKNSETYLSKDWVFRGGNRYVPRWPNQMFSEFFDERSRDKSSLKVVQVVRL